MLQRLLVLLAYKIAMALSMYGMSCSVDHSHVDKIKIMADNTRRTPSPFNVSSLAHPSSQTAHSSLSQSHSFAEDLDSLTFTNEGAELFLTGNTAPSESYNDPDSSVTGELGALDSYSYNVLQFFMSAFSSTDGIIPQIPPMYTASSKDSLVRAAVTALAMERHGLDTSNQGLLAQAQAEYGRTLLKVREALGDPVESRHDQTLATIQLLCHFEVRLFISSTPRRVTQCSIVSPLRHRQHRVYVHPR